MCFEKIEKYWSKHVYFANIAHVIGGLGLGLLIYKYVERYNVFYLGILMIALSLLAHVYAYLAKK